ncbi:unnamed protein product [Phytomonas sp. Hart1]|nr:unnamed protein product [Phytomonas sp. Hart1]|eukprot:CCW70587.1 unnamed protein product [Phytomonas sp. isolate Hart1]
MPMKVPPGRLWLNADESEDPYPLFTTTAIPPKAPGAVRIWVDGCFDLLHFGHANVLRQASLLGTELFVGSHSDEEVIQHKGPPIMHEDERYESLRACKWVNYVIENCPYCTRLKDIERFKIDYVVHGDDISVGLDGRNSYQEIIDAGKFKVVKRTEGISTTDLVGRMLLCTKAHMLNSLDDVDVESANPEAIRTFHYLTTSRKIVQFSNNRVPNKDDKIIYIDGSFDLFHVGHIRVLKKARALGNYLIAGIYEDKECNRFKNHNYPIMNLNERVLGVLSCRYVDEVVMGVPIDITEDIIKSLRIDIVVSGKHSVENDFSLSGIESSYALPKMLGIYREVDSECTLSTEELIERIVKNRMDFIKRQRKKKIDNKKNDEQKPIEYTNVEELC